MAPSATPATQAAAPPSSLTGTWKGGGQGFTLQWVIVQDGANITGSSSFSSTGDGGNGHLTATLSGNTLTFRDEYPLGALSLPNCSEVDSGTVTITGDVMQGTFRSENTCHKAESGSLRLTRQPA